jgi:hypothetical protein
MDLYGEHYADPSLVRKLAFHGRRRIDLPLASAEARRGTQRACVRWFRAALVSAKNTAAGRLPLGRWIRMLEGRRDFHARFSATGPNGRGLFSFQLGLKFGFEVRRAFAVRSSSGIIID